MKSYRESVAEFLRVVGPYLKENPPESRIYEVLGILILDFGSDTCLKYFKKAWRSRVFFIPDPKGRIRSEGRIAICYGNLRRGMGYETPLMQRFVKWGRHHKFDAGNGSSCLPDNQLFRYSEL